MSKCTFLVFILLGCSLSNVAVWFVVSLVLGILSLLHQVFLLYLSSPLSDSPIMYVMPFAVVSDVLPFSFIFSL